MNNMYWVRLTNIWTQKDIYINISSIVAFYSFEEGTKISISNGNECIVEEDIEEVKERIIKLLNGEV